MAAGPPDREGQRGSKNAFMSNSADSSVTGPGSAERAGPVSVPGKAVGIGSGAILNATYFVVTAVVTFFLSPYVLRRLGDAPYGLLNVTWEIGGYFGLFDFGIRSAINYYVARSSASGNLDELRHVIRTAFWLLSGVTALGLLVSYPIAHFSAVLIDRGPLDLGQVRGILWLGLVVFSLNLTGSLAVSVLAGLRRFNWLVITNLAGSISTALLIVGAIESGLGLFAVALAQGLGAILPWIVQQSIIQRWGLTAHLWPPRVERPLASRLLSYGGANFVMRISELLTFQSDQIIIVQALGPAAVAQFHVGRFLALHSRSLVSVLSMVLAPYFTTLSVTGEHQQIKDYFLRLNRWILALASLLAAGVILLGQPFLVLWVGQRFVIGDWWKRSDIVLLFFALAMAFRALSAVPFQFLLGTRRLRFATTVLLLESLALVGTGVFVVRWQGIAGIAILKLVSSVLISGAFVVYSLQEAEVRASDYLRQSLAPALLVGAATAGAAAFLRHWLVISSWPVFFLAASFSAAAGAGAFLLSSTAEDREFMLRKLRTPLG